MGTRGFSRALAAVASLSLFAGGCSDAPDGRVASAKTEGPRPASTAPPAASGASTRLSLVAIRGRFDQPLQVVAPLGDRRRAFVVEETGRVWIVRDGRRSRRPFLDI